MKITKSQLKQMIKEEISEVFSPDDYHDFGGPDEVYDVLDEFENMSDGELMDAAEKEGIEEYIIMDGEGDLANRDEVIAALKNV